MNYLRLVIILLLSSLFAYPAYAKNCRKGIPCGNSCISAKKTCRTSGGSAKSVGPRYTTPKVIVPGVIAPAAKASAKASSPVQPPGKNQIALHVYPSHEAPINGYLQKGAAYTEYSTENGGWVLITPPNDSPHQWFKQSAP